MEVFGFILGRTLISFLFCKIGEKREIGKTWGFVLVFLLGIIGMIIVLCSRKKDIEFINETKEDNQ
ncbi:MAG: hypothetical protein MJZ45_02800 [Bacteroidales bacterium]|nr:hypothetical protein [Bacteroidales bacterium]